MVTNGHIGVSLSTLPRTCPLGFTLQGFCLGVGGFAGHTRKSSIRLSHHHNGVSRSSRAPRHLGIPLRASPVQPCEPCDTFSGRIRTYVPVCYVRRKSGQIHQPSRAGLKSALSRDANSGLPWAFPTRRPTIPMHDQ